MIHENSNEPEIKFHEKKPSDFFLKSRLSETNRDVVVQYCFCSLGNEQLLIKAHWILLKDGCF